jgi:hypothetical protein
VNDAHKYNNALKRLDRLYRKRCVALANLTKATKRYGLTSPEWQQARTRYDAVLAAGDRALEVACKLKSMMLIADFNSVSINNGLWSTNIKPLAARTDNPTGARTLKELPT